jgi:hypothetical protein
MVNAMKSWRRLYLATVFLPGMSVYAQSTTPEGALEELAAARAGAVMKHLPLSVEKRVNELPPEEKARVLNELDLVKTLQREGRQLRRAADGRGWEVLGPEGKIEGTLTLSAAFFSGSEALVPVEFKQEGQSMNILVKLRIEDGEWRIVEAGPWRASNLEHDFPRRISRVSAYESSAVSTLRTLNTALVTYRAQYPEIGFPGSLQALAGIPDQEPSMNHAMMLDESFMATPIIRAGYEYQYVLLDEGHYRITASPIEFGKTGTMSFFTDETCVIRFTSEDRAANESDEVPE